MNRSASHHQHRHRGQWTTTVDTLPHPHVGLPRAGSVRSPTDLDERLHAAYG